MPSLFSDEPCQPSVLNLCPPRLFSASIPIPQSTYIPFIDVFHSTIWLSQYTPRFLILESINQKHTFIPVPQCCKPNLPNSAGVITTTLTSCSRHLLHPTALLLTLLHTYVVIPSSNGLALFLSTRGYNLLVPKGG
jgi:hypothetical protein